MIFLYTELIVVQRNVFRDVTMFFSKIKTPKYLEILVVLIFILFVILCIAYYFIYQQQYKSRDWDEETKVELLTARSESSVYKEFGCFPEECKSSDVFSDASRVNAKVRVFVDYEKFVNEYKSIARYT